LALARLGDAAAAEAFERAAALEPDDPFGRCAHAAYLLHYAEDIRARERLAAPSLEHSSAPGTASAAPGSLIVVAQQFRGACEWAEGQRRLAAGAGAQAAQRFAAAGQQFVAAAAVLSTARQALPERLGAVYMGQAVSLLAAGHIDAALQVYGRLRPPGVRVTSLMQRFARDLHELGRLLSPADAEERRVVSDALVAVVTGGRMQVALWDGSQPVSITWRGTWKE
jgi:hypothetical protein